MGSHSFHASKAVVSVKIKRYSLVVVFAGILTAILAMFPNPVNTTPFTNTSVHDPDGLAYVLYRLEKINNLETAQASSLSLCGHQTLLIKSYGLPMTIRTYIPLGCESGGKQVGYNRIAPLAVAVDITAISILLVLLIRFTPLKLRY